MSWKVKLRSSLERLESEYKRSGTVSWATFSADQAGNQKKVVELSQADFDSGTLRIKYPCKLKFTEDVLFNPNPGQKLADGKIDPARTQDWFPLHTQTEYQEPSVSAAYHLGFFAAITVEAEGVIVDLNQNTLGMAKEFALMQQFYANIELSDQPFPTSSGPAEFGAKLRAARKCWIKDGTLGYSSHQSIHGNQATDVLISDVTMRDMTVAGISMNGSRRIAVIDCEVKEIRQDVPVRGAFNEIRLGVKILDGYTASGATLPAETQAAYDAAKLAVEKIFDDVAAHGEIQAGTLTAADAAVLQNAKLHDVLYWDAVSYGMVFNATDNATGPFLKSRDLKGNEASEIAVIRCNIEAIETESREVLALSPAIDEAQEIESAGEVLYDVNSNMRGPTGNVFDFTKAFKLDPTAYPQDHADRGKWAGNVVADLQIELSALQNDLAANPATAALAPRIGQINMEPEFIKMKRGEAGTEGWALLTVGETVEPAEGDKVYILFDKSTFVDGAPAPDDASLVVPSDASRGLDELEFVVLAMGDGQHHVAKGMVAFRAEGVSDLEVEHLTISECENNGPEGYGYYTPHGGLIQASEMGYVGDKDGGHGGQGTGMVGYFGNHARGMKIAGCTDVSLKDIKLSNIVGVKGPAIAVDISGETSRLTLEGLDIKAVHGGEDQTVVDVKNRKRYPNWLASATGLRIDDSCRQIKVSGVRVEGLTQPAGDPKELEIESDDADINK